jgi:hypothetical protein
MDHATSMEVFGPKPHDGFDGCDVREDGVNLVIQVRAIPHPALSEIE